MTIRVLVAMLPLVGVLGCVEGQRSQLVAPGDSLTTSIVTALRPPMLGPRLPPHEVSAKRALGVAHALFDANQQAGVRPCVITVGVPHSEIFHTGGGTRGYQIYLSEGLINSCKNDAQLAAVLALEMGKIVTEREATSGPAGSDEVRLPPDVPVGSDNGGTFGPPDGTRRMELAKLDPKRPKPGKPAVPTTPEALAKGYLTKARHEPGALEEVAPLLRKAEDNYEVEKSFKQAEIGAPVRAN